MAVIDNKKPASGASVSVRNFFLHPFQILERVNQFST
jgi:hypothetical protein